MVLEAPLLPAAGGKTAERRFPLLPNRRPVTVSETGPAPAPLPTRARITRFQSPSVDRLPKRRLSRIEKHEVCFYSHFLGHCLVLQRSSGATSGQPSEHYCHFSRRFRLR